jgi:hypothetical protein
MDARQYLGQFSEASEPTDVYLPVGPVGDLAFETSSVLYGTIKSLYQSRDVLFLGDNIQPAILTAASNRIAEEREVRRILDDAARNQTRGLRRQPGYVSDKLYVTPDTSLEQDSSQVAQSVTEGLGAMNNSLMYSSALVLDNTVLALAKHLNKNNLSDPTTSSPHYGQIASAAVVRSLQQFRPLIANELSQFVGAVDVTRDSHNGVLTGAVKVQPVSGRSHAQKWFAATEAWDVPIQAALSKGFEFDVYAALYEWVIDRKLPFVPVIAPAHIENGKTSEAALKNPRADILLCSLVDESIIPVQVKFHRDAKGEYHDDVRIITPRVLGLVDVKHDRVRTGDGRMRTGEKVTTHVGLFANSFGALYGTLRKGQKPRRPEYQPRLQRAFDAFDMKFSDDLATFKQAS